MTTEMKNENRPSREWLLRMAEAEDRCPSVTVGGLASDLGMLPTAVSEGPRVFARFIQFARRARGLSLDELAERADVDVAELIAIETAGAKPVPRTVYQLARELRLSTGKLMELAGLAEPKDPSLGEAALRFAARSEPTAKLSKEERQAFEEFVKVLVEASDAGS